MIRKLTILLLIFGCTLWIPTVWELDMTLEEFKAKNDNLILMRVTIVNGIADTVIYKRMEPFDHWNSRPRYYTYTFVDGNLSVIDRVARKPIPKEPQTQKIEVEIK